MISAWLVLLLVITPTQVWCWWCPDAACQPCLVSPGASLDASTGCVLVDGIEGKGSDPILCPPPAPECRWQGRDQRTGKYVSVYRPSCLLGP